MSVVEIEIFANRRFRVSGAAKHAAANLFFREESKPALDQIDPRCTGWCEMEVKARSVHQPALDGGRFVGPVVVDNQMYIKVLGDGLVKSHSGLPVGIDRNMPWSRQTL